jgi:hypothetical protein
MKKRRFPLRRSASSFRQGELSAEPECGYTPFMATEEETPIEIEFIRTAVATDVKVTKTEKKPTTVDDAWVRIDGRLGEEEDDDVEWAAMGFIYAISALSFGDARPRGVSDMHFKEDDEWTAIDALRHIRFVRGELNFSADYVRGRCMKTDLDVRSDGTFTLTTTNRGEAATRWIGRLQGKKPLAPVATEPTPGAP